MVAKTVSGTTLQTSAGTLEDLDRAHLVHPQQSGDHPDRLIVVRGFGCTVWDAHGREYLDIAGAGNWACQVGHGRAELVAAGAEQSAQLAYFSGFYGYSNDKAVQLATRLAGLAPAGLDHVFFTCGGSEAVDSAMKIARLYHSHRHEPERTWFISRHFGYHGSTYGSGTLTGFPDMHEGIGPGLPHVEKVSPPNPYRAGELYGSEDPTAFLLRELEETIQRIGPGKVAAMIGEPVMAGAGVLVPPADYWPRVRELLSRHGILLIADEVVTAFGRSGHWFDSPARGMSPDIITAAKGLTSGYAPLGAVLMRGEVAETVAGAGVTFGHGHTYSAHPTACAIALANLDVLEQDGLIDRARVVEGWLREDLAPLSRLPRVGDVRVVGAMAAVELVADQASREPVMGEAVSERLQHEHGIILRAYGQNVVLCPALVIERAQIRRAVDALAEVLLRLGPDGRVAV
ncbi:aspartate aminotransferase family protein [Streptomyces sp. NPDC007088]|uniref:aminotransferase family protein n=1 Tax=Streptomyces sp. NPDC007088 TaxID=3364773 RepID=UPI0036CFD805